MLVAWGFLLRAIWYDAAVKSNPPQSDDQSFEWLYDQLKLLSKRVERLEGKCEQLRSERGLSSLTCPTRREFEDLQARFERLERPREN